MSAPSRILVFPMGQEGNLAPLRMIDNEAIEGATSLSVDSSHDELFIANPTKGEVQVLKRLANKYGPRSIYSQDVQRSFSVVGASSVKTVVSVEARNQVAITAGDGQIQMIDRNASGIVKALQKIQAPSMSANPVVASNGKNLQWIQSDGSVGEKSLEN